MQTLTEPELGIMQVLWAAREAIPRAEIQRQLSHLGWKTSTFNTYLGRLQQKGFVEGENRGQTAYYRPLVAREAYQQAEGASMLGRLFEGSLKSFVLSLSGTDAVDRQDLDELQVLLAQLKGGGEDGA